MAFNQTYEEAKLRANSRPQKPRKALSRGKGFQKAVEGASLVFPAPSAHLLEKTGNGLKRSRIARKGRQGAKKKTKRTRMPTRKRLIKDLDNLTSQIVRLRDGRCVECGSVDSPTNGHVLGRRSFATRFDITPDGDCHQQCWPDNFRAARTAAVSYHAWYVRTFGAEAFDRLYRRWAAGKKYSRLELIALRSEYQIKLAEMQK